MTSLSLSLSLDNSSGSTVISDTVLVYESDGVTNEEAWLKAMSRIDPHEHLSKYVTR